jgi:hypothetical protein
MTLYNNIQYPFKIFQPDSYHARLWVSAFGELQSIIIIVAVALKGAIAEARFVFTWLVHTFPPMDVTGN